MHGILGVGGGRFKMKSLEINCLVPPTTSHWVNFNGSIHPNRIVNYALNKMTLNVPPLCIALSLFLS